MSLTKRMLDREEEAERLNRGAEDMYYGEEWPSEQEMRDDEDERSDQYRE